MALPVIDSFFGPTYNCMNAVQWLVQTESLGTTVARLVGWLVFNGTFSTKRL